MDIMFISSKIDNKLLKNIQRDGKIVKIIMLFVFCVKTIAFLSKYGIINKKGGFYGEE